MAYLTKYNFSKLCQTIEINRHISMDAFLKYIYDDKEVYYILNKMEIEFLFKYKMMLKDEKKFLVEFYKEIPEREDTKTMVFNRGGKIKYHLTDKCKLLRKDYIDFDIPIDIQEEGDEAIEEYRNWFKSNNYGENYKLGKITKDRIIRDFNLKYPSKYGLKPIENNSNILVVEIPNSSKEQLIEEFDIKGFKERITALKTKWRNYFPCKVSRTFSKYKYLLRKSDEEIKSKMTELFTEHFADNYGIENLKNKFLISKRINNEVISELLEYFKWTYEIDNKEFDILTLEKFGLECCNSCKREAKS